MFTSKKQNKINIQSMKDAIDPDNNKIWWNTRDGHIVKTTYNETTNRFLIEKQPFGIRPSGIPIHFQSNIISEF